MRCALLPKILKSKFTRQQRRNNKSILMLNSEPWQQQSINKKQESLKRSNEY